MNKNIVPAYEHAMYDVRRLLNQHDDIKNCETLKPFLIMEDIEYDESSLWIQENMNLFIKHCDELIESITNTGNGADNYTIASGLAQLLNMVGNINSIKLPKEMDAIIEDYSNKVTFNDEVSLVHILQFSICRWSMGSLSMV